MQSLIALCLFSWTRAQVPIEHAAELTVYHVNPLSDGVIPINMDIADALGDIFFDFRSKVLPIECSQNRTHHPLDCTNQEVVAPDLVITKLELIVDKRFGEYGECNICVNNTAGPLKNCTNGEYVCACGHPPSLCSKAVGYENITDSFGLKGGCWPGQADWQCWKNSVATKTGGQWFSTTASGYCGDGSKPAPEGCTWSVKKVAKVVNKSCSDNIVYNFFETYDHRASHCFASCSDSGLGRARNTSSLCWTRCFYETLLGPDAGRPGGKITGIPREKIVEVWEKAFVKSWELEDDCPALLPPSVGLCMGISSVGRRGALTNARCSKDADCKSSHWCSVQFHLAQVDAFSLVV